MNIADLIPHQDAMCLLERVLAWDAQHLIARTATHRDPAHPLLGTTGLRAIHLSEYGAQAAALHGGLHAHARGETAPPGLLVALRDVRLRRVFIHDLPGEIEIEVQLLLAGAGGRQYSFEARHAGEVLAAGRLAVMRPGSPAK